jgi:tetratricopeptide (TPR) repeat protein
MPESHSSVPPSTAHSAARPPFDVHALVRGETSLPPTLARAIDEACTRFERAWKAGQRPRIEDVLGDRPEPERSSLLRELMALEIDYRRQAGETPQRQEYHARFPALSTVVDRVFDEPSTLALHSVSEPGTALPTIPGYEILGELGHGGMGVVYWAWQTGLHRPVALKAILAGAHANALQLARFRVEAEAVARLQHANIVQIHDIGEHEGRPYFALEYVDGGSLARQLNGTPWPVDRAASLVETLAQAIDHAHRQGIVHRDLKPANVLLTKDGQAKITDFGLAKILVGGGPAVTQTGAILGTPSYMAPEQAGAQTTGIGPVTDVYALGAILYQLLTGRPPFQAATPLETVLQVQHDEPVSPSRLQPKLPRDLTTICLKCLDKEPGRRYASAQAVADDLRCFLDGRPIQARPVRVWERVVKWSRRRPAVSALLGILGLVLVGAFFGMLGLWLRADQERTAAERAREDEAHQRAAAERERAAAEAVSAFLQHDLLGQADIGNQQQLGGQQERKPHITVTELLDRAATGIDGKFPDQPEVEAAIRQTIGDTYQALGAYNQALEHMNRALALRRRHLGNDHPATLASLNNLATLNWDLGRYDDAEPLYHEALEGRRRILGADHPETLKSLNNLGFLYQARGRHDEAEPLFKQALEGHRRRLGANHPDTLTNLNNLALLYVACGRYDDAEPLFKEALDGRQRQLGADHPATLRSLNNLAGVYQARGRYDDAEPLFKEALDGRRRTLGADHRDTLQSMNNLALLYKTRRRYDKAEPLYQEALEGSRRRLGANHPDTLQSLSNLAVLYQALRRYDEAEGLLKEAVEGSRRTLGRHHPDSLVYLSNLAFLYKARGLFDKAESLNREALEGFRRLGADHPHTLQSLDNLAGLYKARRRYDEAEPFYLEAVSGARRKLGLAHPKTKIYVEHLADLYELAGKPAQAEPLWRELAEVVKQQAGPESSDYAAELARLGGNQLKQHKPAEAEPLLRASLTIRQRNEPDAWTTFNTQSLLGGALCGQQKYAEAETLLLQGYEGMKQREPKLPANGAARLSEALERLVQLYDAWGKKAQADQWRQTQQDAKVRDH